MSSIYLSQQSTEDVRFLAADSNSSINRQNELLKAVNNVSSILLDPDVDNFEDSLLKSMSTMGNAVDVDRVCIWKNHEKDGLMHCTMAYEWVSDYRMQKGGWYTANVSYDDVLHSWQETLSQGKIINSMVRNMSAREQAKLNAHGILSIFVTPVFVHDEFWGCVAYCDCRRERTFSDDEEDILRSVGRMFVSAFIHSDMTNKIIDMSVELTKAKEQAERSNRSKTLFLSQMSHEIRTPMNAILGIAEIHLRDENLQPAMQEAFGKIYESGDLLLNIINDILDLSKIEARKLELIPAKYDIPSLINDTAQLNRMLNDSKLINFSIYVDENTPHDLYGDELRIKQILNNILSNAFKYTDEGKIVFDVSTETEQDDCVTLKFRISDTGQGMTDEQIRNLFVEYNRFNAEANREKVGTGLGMSITKRLIDLMNGSLQIRSEPGKGTEFTVRLPQKRVGSERCGNEITGKLRSFNYCNAKITKKTQFVREYMPYGKVLVVDDVESNIYVAKGMLSPYGLKIDTASSGFEAIKKIKDGNAYDIVFMDHMMPKMDGIETTKKIRDMGYTNTIAMLTANAIIGRAEMFLKNGFDRFISKPIDSRELNLMLNELIRNKQPPEVIEAARREMAYSVGTKHRNASFGAITEEASVNNELTAAASHDVENALSVLEELLPKINTGKADLRLFATTVHGMKSALANIGEKPLSNIAHRLEEAVHNGEKTVILDETPKFMNSLMSLMEKIKLQKADYNGEVSGAITSEDMVFLRNKLDDIKTACGNFMLKDAKTALNGLKQKAWSLKINDIINEISLFLIRGEYAKVVSTVEKMTEFIAA